MSTFIVPDDGPDAEPWPSLGGQICDLIEERAVFGPGSLKGEPAALDDEKRAAIWKAYEVYPKGHDLEGRRRHRRVRFSWRKGTAKTEFGGWITFAELHPEGETRFDGWRKVDGVWQPVGRPVRDPYIPMLAYTQEQVMELAYGVLYTVCTEGPDADLFDVTMERIVRIGANGRADGKAVPLATTPNARDGARTTMNFYDETHRLTLPSQVSAYETMEANLPKRPLDDPWSLGVTTAGVPGQGSVAEKDKDEAEAIARGEVDEPELFYFHREAAPNHDLTTLKGRVEAVREASGPAVAEWSDLRGIAKQWDRPGADLRYLERTWLNRWTQADAQAFDVQAWRDNARETARPNAGATVAIGLDGSIWKDTTAIVVTDLSTRIQHAFALWEPDENNPVLPDDVDLKVREAFDRWNVARMYVDPAMGYDKLVSDWKGRYGEKHVLEFYTDSRGKLKTAYMCRRYDQAIRGGDCLNDGDPVMASHIGHAQKRDAKVVDDEGIPMWSMTKERHDSPNKIDYAMAGGLSWQAYLDAVASGAGQESPNYVYY
ncbi:hypothetical protein [Demequina sp. SO4-18]|uniref:hypothetical protein n=1 Tax=Demequina sp. SO4-18 TaxID=3401026 RepID=UPI003B5C5E22